MCFNFFKKNKKSAVEPVIEKPVEAPVQSHADVEEPVNFSFKLHVEDESNSGLGRTVCDPSDSALDEAVDVLKHCENNFLVFESKAPINECTFIQANGYNQGEGTVYSEIQHIENKNGKRVLSNYYKVMNIEAFKELVKAFAHGNTPNIYEWDHMMDFDDED